MKRERDFLQAEMRFARKIWRPTNRRQMQELRALLQRYKLSISLGEIILLNNHWYVTHSGLLQVASRHRCGGIKTVLKERLCDPAANRWVFKAVVHKSAGSKGFVGYGDADPSNVSTLVQGAEMRIAETRAVNRALRKAYGIGLCSVEELGSLSRDPGASRSHEPAADRPSHNGTGNGQPRLRDQLCVVIRQYNLDPTLVKAYAADFCGTQSLREARRELVESFIKQLATSAKENREVLIAKLNSYAQPQEARL